MIGIIARYATGRVIVRKSTSPRGLRMLLPDGSPIEILISDTAPPEHIEHCHSKVCHKVGRVVVCHFEVVAHSQLAVDMGDTQLVNP